MVAVYRRLGFSMTGQMLRLAMPLRVDRRVKEWIRNRAAQRVLSSVGNAVLKMSLPKVPEDNALDVSVQSGPCGEEFTALSEPQGWKLRIFLKRSAEYLNWRYVNNPLSSYEIITARRHGKLKGYAVWTEAGQDGSVVDLFGEDNPAIVKALLAGVVGRLTDRGVMTLSIWLNELHPWLSWCLEMGFGVRESAPIVCLPRPSIETPDGVRSATWFLMQGDRDN
jgi:hypothetical protein